MHADKRLTLRDNIHSVVQWCTPISSAIGHVGTAPFKVFLDQAIQYAHVVRLCPAVLTTSCQLEVRT